MSDLPAPEFSRKVDLREIGDKPVLLSATAQECAALARRFGIVAVLRLDAEVSLEPKGQTILATGSFTADIVQSCAISAEDLPVHIAEPLTLRFIPARACRARSRPKSSWLRTIATKSNTPAQLSIWARKSRKAWLWRLTRSSSGPWRRRARRKAGLMDAENSGPFAALRCLEDGRKD